jgi:4-methyl-5(b-hydroxyethyl)-thiazole monophosphate biosynthesis
MSKKILVPLAQGLEEVEAITIIDILRRGGLEVITVGLDTLTILGSHNITIMADQLLSEIDPEDFDGVVLPGGMPGTLNLKANDNIDIILKNFFQKNKFIGAICAAPMVLEKAGVLENKKFTIHPGVIDDISLKPINSPVVEDGNIITGQASGAATAFALKIVEKLQGKDKMEKVNNGVLFKF